MTPLHMATAKRHVPTIITLLKLNSIIMIEDNQGKTPIDYALDS